VGKRGEKESFLGIIFESVAPRDVCVGCYRNYNVRLFRQWSNDSIIYEGAEKYGER